jgi:hypothetical protein
MKKNYMFCFSDVLFVILLMYYNVCHIVFWDYNCSFAIFLICMTISTSNGLLLPNKDLRNVNKWWWLWRWHDAHRKLAFSTLAHDTLGITPLAAGVVTTFRTSAKNAVWELIDYISYIIFRVSTLVKDLMVAHSYSQNM